VQFGGKPLKTEGADQPVPIPRDLALPLSASVQTYGTEWMVTNCYGRACSRVAIMRAIATARSKVEGLPEGFTYHDLRHYLASLLIASGADIKTVQARLRHATASGEMAALTVADFDMLRRRVHIRRSVTEAKGRLVWSTPKNHERRSVPFPAFVVDELAARMVGSVEMMWFSLRRRAGCCVSRLSAPVCSIRR